MTGLVYTGGAVITASAISTLYGTKKASDLRRMGKYDEADNIENLTKLIVPIVAGLSLLYFLLTFPFGIVFM